MTQPVYVYGVLATADAASLAISGVMDAPVRTVESGDLTALVSDVAGDALSAAREVRAHWRVLEAAAEQATVVPVRFGTVMEDDAAVRGQLLEPDAERLTAVLEQLRGRVQLIVRGSYDGEALLHAVVAGSPAIASLRDRVRGLPEAAGYYERIRLGEAIAAEVQRHQAADTAHALERLSPLAAATREERAGGPDDAFNLAFLVEHDAIDRFSKAVTTLADDLGAHVAIRYLGPVAPYSFVDAGTAAGVA